MIVVTTPTGQIGHQVVDALLAAGAPVRVVVRDPSRLAPEVRGRVEVVRGTHSEPDVAAAALEGADALLWVVPPDFAAADVVEHYLRFTRPAAEAVTARGVARVVGVSSLGREVASGVGLVTAAYAMDALLEGTGSAYRALRMPAFMEDVLLQLEPLRAEGVWYGAQDGERRVPVCATRDIAATATGLLLDPTWRGTGSAPVLGPEDLSFDELASVMSEVLGTSVRYEQVPPDAYRDRLEAAGMSRAWAHGLLDNQLEASRGIYNAEPRTASATTPTSFRTWCEQELLPRWTA